MGEKFLNVLLYTEVCWLSRGRVLCRVYELREMMLQLFRENMHNEFCDLIRNKIWCTKLAYLADIFDHLNKLNTSIKGKRENVLTSVNKIFVIRDKITIWIRKGKRGNVLTPVDKICAIRDKITIWIRKVKESNFKSFPKTAECELKNDISLLIVDHLILLQNKINNYFPNLEIQDYDWNRNPFISTNTRNLSLVEEEELAEIKNDRSLFIMYKESDLDRFWVCVSRIHLNIGNKALKILLQFSTTYIFEESFSTMTNIKSMKRGSLKMLGDEMRLSLSYIQPNIKTLCSSHQAHVSH